jgi:hypothetical protein
MKSSCIPTPEEIASKIETLHDELRVRKDEILSYKSKIDEM